MPIAITQTWGGPRRLGGRRRRVLSGRVPAARLDSGGPGASGRRGCQKVEPAEPATTAASERRADAGRGERTISDRERRRGMPGVSWRATDSAFNGFGGHSMTTRNPRSNAVWSSVSCSAVGCRPGSTRRGRVVRNRSAEVANEPPRIDEIEGPPWSEHRPLRVDLGLLGIGVLRPEVAAPFADVTGQVEDPLLGLVLRKRADLAAWSGLRRSPRLSILAIRRLGFSLLPRR